MRFVAVILAVLFVSSCGDSSNNEKTEHVTIRYEDDPPDMLNSAQKPIN
jgi:ABC-type Fe3+-citrate transport system substrate-binding protein